VSGASLRLVIQWREMRPLSISLTRAILVATLVACFVLAGCGQGSGQGSPGPVDRTASAHTDAQTPELGGADKGGPKPLGIGAKNEEPVPNVVGKPIEAACRTLSRAGHAGEVSYVSRAEGVEPGRVLAQDIEPGTNKGASMLVYLTVSGPFSEKELSANTYCANPQPDIDDAPPRGSGQ
jgi:hypothetical protein